MNGMGRGFEVFTEVNEANEGGMKAKARGCGGAMGRGRLGGGALVVGGGVFHGF